MTDKQPGDIIAYRRRPRGRSEILCHNQVLHTRDMAHGVNGFRWFTARAGGDWKVCPCGWRPELGAHYAWAKHVKFWRDLRKRLRSQEAIHRYIAERIFPSGEGNRMTMNEVDAEAIAADLIKAVRRSCATATPLGDDEWVFAVSPATYRLAVQLGEQITPEGVVLGPLALSRMERWLRQQGFIKSANAVADEMERACAIWDGIDCIAGNNPWEPDRQ
jgi:hypothetical protein